MKCQLEVKISEVNLWTIGFFQEDLYGRLTREDKQNKTWHSPTKYAFSYLRKFKDTFRRELSLLKM